MKQDLKVRQLAFLLHVHPATIRRLARAGKLSGAYKVGSQWRFAREAVELMRGEVQRGTYFSPRLSPGDMEWSGEQFD